MVQDPIQQALKDLRVDRSNLYREETYTDLKVATLKKLVPITPEGETDLGRKPIWVAQTQIMSQMGPLPVQAPLDARNLQEALEKFPAAIQQGVERLMDEVREVQRREASRIVTPGSGMGMGPLDKMGGGR